MTNASLAARIDKVGKVFRVEEGMRRRCMVCEKLFTRQAATEHAKVTCYPTLSRWSN